MENLDRILTCLCDARSEIENLRKRVAVLEPKAHAYDSLAIVIRNNAPPTGPSWSKVDVVWELSSAISELEGGAAEADRIEAE